MAAFVILLRVKEAVSVPNYEYECKACQKRFEIWQPVGEAAPECPSCASEVKKVFHPPRVIFKGSGFYVTDLRAEKDARSAKKENGDSAKSDTSKTESTTASSDSTSSDSKTPAPKADAPASTSNPAPAASTPAS